MNGLHWLCCLFSCLMGWKLNQMKAKRWSAANHDLTWPRTFSIPQPPMEGPQFYTRISVTFKNS